MFCVIGLIVNTNINSRIWDFPNNKKLVLKEEETSSDYSGNCGPKSYNKMKNNSFQQLCTILL